MFFRLLLESFRRQQRRKLLAGLAIVLGTTAVAAMLALATTIGDRIHAELAVYGANIVVTPQASALAVNIGGTDIRPATANAFLHESDLAKLKTIFWANNITGISPELTVPANLSGSAQTSFLPATIIGYRYGASPGTGGGSPGLHPWWKLKGSWPGRGTDTKQVVLGSTLARTLGATIGSVIYRSIDVGKDAPPVHGVGPSPLTVVGIVTTGDATDNAALMDLSDVQVLSNLPDALTSVDISARTKPEDAFARQDPDKLPPAQREIWYCRPYANSIAYQIREAIPGADAQQLRRVEQSEGKVLSRISGLMALLAAAALLAAGFAVSSAMATAVLERRVEIGLMRSLGASRGSIAGLFYAETAILALLGGTIGYLAGSALATVLSARIFPGTATAAVFNPVLLPIVVGLALLVAIAGSSPSIRSALRQDPSAVLRSNA